MRGFIFAVGIAALKLVFSLQASELAIILSNSDLLVEIESSVANCHGTTQRPQEEHDGIRTKTRKLS